jgi:ABC-2 type transport system permease protein
MTVKTSGLSQNILRLFLDQVNQRFSMIKSISMVNPESMESFVKALGESVTYTIEKEKSTAPPSQILNYFYSLIAMACMYGAFFGSDEITDIEANISMRAARIQVAPVHKLKAFAASSLASYTVLLVNTSILLLFLSYVLGIDFGERAFYIVLTAFAGTLTGITFGSFISSLVKKNENIKAAVIVAVTMGGSFLAGMMYAQMKYIVYDKVPVLAYLNPVNLITDSFYSLYYFTDMGRYFQNLALLLVMTVVFGLGTYLSLRRRRYASI